MDSTPSTLQQAVIHFADYENCHRFLVELRWPDGKVACPNCGSDHVKYLEKARVWKCYATHPKAKFSVKVGTIFEDSPIPLQKWLPAAWLIINCKNGVSSYEIARDLGVTQKTAWFMLQRIRLSLQNGSFVKLGGPGKEIEVDETFIGAKARNMHKPIRARRIKGPGPQGKDVVMAVLERNGQVRAKVVPNTGQQVLQGHVREHVHAGSEVFTDAHPGYDGLDQDYLHGVIDHAEAYVDGKIHTNGLENFWSLLKRSVKGTYVSIEPFHLFRYVDEQAFRYNNRKVTDAERFAVGLSQITGRRLTYKELTGKQDARP